MTVTRIVLVTKRTPYEDLLSEFGTHGQASFVLQSRGESIESYKLQHDAYHAAVQQVESDLPSDIAHTFVERSALPHALFRADDLVIAIGPDGLFANLAKYLSGQPVVGVNPLPKLINGVLMQHAPGETGLVIENLVTLSNQIDLKTCCQEVVLAEAKTDDGGRLLAVNDFLVGRLDHVSARYRINSLTAQQQEKQSSSGVLVSTGLGSSGWLRSLRTAVQSASTRSDLRQFPADPAWDEERLVFAVREPFVSQSTQADLVYGTVLPNASLEIVSEMPTGGVVFSDGVPEDALRLPAGTKLTIGIASEKAYLISK